MNRGKLPWLILPAVAVLLLAACSNWNNLSNWKYGDRSTPANLLNTFYVSVDRGDTNMSKACFIDRAYIDSERQYGRGSILVRLRELYGGTRFDRVTYFGRMRSDRTVPRYLLQWQCRKVDPGTDSVDLVRENSEIYRTNGVFLLDRIYSVGDSLDD